MLGASCGVGEWGAAPHRVLGVTGGVGRGVGGVGGAATGTVLPGTWPGAPGASGRARRGGGTAATRQYVKQKDISFYLPAAAPGHNPPTFNLYSTTHVSFPASDYFLSSNYCGDKME